MEILLLTILLLVLSLFLLVVSTGMRGLSGKAEAAKFIKEMTALPPGFISAELGPLAPKDIYICRTGPYVITDDDLQRILESAPEDTKYINIETIGRIFKAQSNLGGTACEYIY